MGESEEKDVKNINHDPNTGRFTKGNTANTSLSLPKELRQSLKDNRRKLIRAFDDFGAMEMSELDDRMKPENQKYLTAAQKTAAKFWDTLSSKSDPALLKMMFHLYGIPIDVKAISITDNLLGTPGPESNDDNEGPMKMTKEQKKRALLIALEAVEKEEDES